MTINAPTGWKTPDSAPVEDDLCGEPQDCDSPPCGSIPPPTLTNLGHNSLGIDSNFDCEVPITDVNIHVGGGTPPFEWVIVTNNGSITELDMRTVKISLNAYAGLFMHCDSENEERNNAQAYAIVGKAPFNNGAGDSCNDFEGGPAFGGLTFNCNDQIIGCGLAPGVVNDDGLTLTQDDFPTLCQQVNLINNNGAEDCGLPWCGSPAYGVCNCIATGGNDTFGDITGYILTHGMPGLLVDIRTADLKANGCAPCRLLKNTDIVVSVQDANGAMAAVIIHVNA